MKKFNLKDVNKNTLLIIAAVVACAMLFVAYLKAKEKSEVPYSIQNESVALEPISVSEEKQSKLDAYKKDKEANRRELQEQTVKGSDFFFDMQGSDARYNKLKERKREMESDPYEEVMGEYQQGGRKSFSNQISQQIDELGDKQKYEEWLRENKREEEKQKEFKEYAELQRELLGKALPSAAPQVTSDTTLVFPKVVSNVPDESLEHRFVVKDGKRHRRDRYVAAGKKNLIRAAIHSDQTIVSGTPVKMRLLEPLFISGVEIPANTIFSGTASLGASRLNVTVDNFRYGDYLSPVSFCIYDLDAIKGLNLPNNMSAEASKRMEQGLLQGVQLPFSSIGTVTSEVTSAITASTQVTKQILNQSLAQVKVHLKANYQIYLKEETREDRRKREAENAELERLYQEHNKQKNEPVKANPLVTLLNDM